MNSNISVPTDNPYKLMAIIGSIIFISSLYFLFVQSYKNNEIIFQSAEKILVIQAKTELAENVKELHTDIETRKIDIAASDNKTLPFLCALISFIGLCISFYGFYHWLTKVYPDEEALRKEQIKHLKLTNKELSRKKIGLRT